jgi:hypothetical protein
MNKCMNSYSSKKIINNVMYDDNCKCIFHIRYFINVHVA